MRISAYGFIMTHMDSSTRRPKLSTCYRRFKTPSGFELVERMWVLLMHDGGSEELALYRGTTPTQAKRLAFIRFGLVPELI